MGTAPEKIEPVNRRAHGTDSCHDYASPERQNKWPKTDGHDYGHDREPVCGHVLQVLVVHAATLTQLTGEVEGG